MMQKNYFIKRFLRFFLIMMIPMTIAFVISFVIVNRQSESSLNIQSENTLSSVDTNLDVVISSVVLQNDQLTNNSHMLLALKKLLRRDEKISYSEAVSLRNIKLMMNSIVESYPYIGSVYLYLDGYENFFSSDSGVTEVTDSSFAECLENYQAMEEEQDNYVETREMIDGNKTVEVLTIYQRLRVIDGVVIMNIDIEQYQELMDLILVDRYETVLLINDDNEVLFSWNDTNNTADNFDASAYRSGSRDGSWIRVNRKKYMVNTSYNSQYRLQIVSLVSYDAKLDDFWPILRIYLIVFIVNSMTVAVLAYMTTKYNFAHLNYLVQVFYDAESGTIPTQPCAETRDEYDVIMNNIIYLFLHNMQLTSELTAKKHEQEIATLAALQLQINPHFLFNTLQTIQLDLKKDDFNPQKLDRVLSDLADILKYALADPMKMITLREEIAYLKKYVAIQKFRFGDKFILYYEINEELMDYQVFRLMLQPLVENSILHGIRPSDKRGYIKLQIFKRGERIICRVVDNGIGMNKEEKERLKVSIRQTDSSHIGLSNVNSRLILYYGEESGLKIHSKEGMGTVMELSLPA